MEKHRELATKKSIATSAFAPTAWRRPSGNNIIMSHLVHNIQWLHRFYINVAQLWEDRRLEGKVECETTDQPNTVHLTLSSVGFRNDPKVRSHVTRWRQGLSPGEWLPIMCLRQEPGRRGVRFYIPSSSWPRKGP